MSRYIFDNPPQGERFWNYLSLEGEYTGDDDSAHFLRQRPTPISDPDWKLTEVIVFIPQELAERDKEIARDAWLRCVEAHRTEGLHTFDGYWQHRMELAEKKAHGEEKRRDEKGE